MVVWSAARRPLTWIGLARLPQRDSYLPFEEAVRSPTRPSIYSSVLKQSCAEDLARLYAYLGPKAETSRVQPENWRAQKSPDGLLFPAGSTGQPRRI
jgi:hypothetical protein